MQNIRIVYYFALSLYQQKSSNHLQTSKFNIMSASVKTFGQLTIGTVVNYSNLTVGVDTNYVILSHSEQTFGSFTHVLNLETFEKDSFTQHTEIKNRWSIVKEN